MESITGDPYRLIKYLVDIPDKTKLYDLNEHKEKRSLSQNAYSWKLSNQLADKLGMSKETMHFQLLKDYGQSEKVSVLSNINLKGYCTYIEEIGHSSLNGKEFTHYKVYKPTHEMDSKEMSIFIDGLIQECENVGIPTLTKEEIERMKLI